MNDFRPKCFDLSDLFDGIEGQGRRLSAQFGMFAPHMHLLQGWSVGGVVVGGILSLAMFGICWKGLNIYTLW